VAGIFKAYDIRGRYPDELNEAEAKKIGMAFVSFLKARRIVIGFDMRLSSKSLADAFVEGARSLEVAVEDIGMVTTPLLYYAIIYGKYDGGAMVTASHLPGGINGFKLCGEKAIPLSGDHGLPAVETMVNRTTDSAAEVRTQGQYRRITLLERYINDLSYFVHNPRPLRVAVDAGNGMAGPEVSVFFKKHPVWTCIPLYTEPDGHFPHHIANPLLTDTTRDLQAVVVKENADVGVAFDGDADRCGFIDEKGERIPEDLVTALIAEFLLAKEPGATILYDLRSSRIVPETISRLGGKAIRTRVGHAFIKAAMRQYNALFAGELSGHYYYRDTGFTDNALFTMIQMSNLLSARNVPISYLVEPLKKYHSTGEINMKVKDPDAIFTALEKKFAEAEVEHLDGLTIECKSWWFNLRLSNTEPVMRLNLETNSERMLSEKKLDVIRTISDADAAMTLQP
jgi:phosphomannomutase